MKNVSPDARPALANLFSCYAVERVLIDGCLHEGRGHAWVDDVDKPTVAVLSHLYAAVVAGSVHHPEAVDIARQLAHAPLVAIVPDPSWLELMKRTHGRRLHAAVWTWLSSRGLRAPEATGMDIDPVDLDLARDLQQRFPRHFSLSSYGDDPRRLVSEGMAYVARSGGDVIGFVNSLAVGAGGLKGHIWVAESHRRQGVARALATRMWRACEFRELHYEWAAANPASRALARRVGLVEVGSADVLRVRPRGPAPRPRWIR